MKKATSKRLGSGRSRASRFKAFTDEHRLQIIELLHRAPSTVTTIAATLGLPQSLTSHHLLSLKKAGILSVVRQGRSHIYQLAPRLTAKGGSPVIDLDCCTVTIK